MNTVANLWDSFRSVVIPSDAPPVQVQEMRRAFYAGVFAVVTEPNADGGLLDRYESECIKFKQDVLAGRA